MANTVVVKIVGDASQFRSEMGSTENRLEQVSRKLFSFGAKMTLGVTTPLVLAGKAGVDAASSLEQSTGAIESVFGSAAVKIEEFGATAAQSAGLSKRQVNEMAAVIGASLTNMGYPVDQAADKVIELEKRAADLAATFGGSTEDAIQSMAAALRGERDPIEKYGVSIKEADVQARILAMGLDTSTEAAKKKATADATLSLILEQTARAEGQFARETDTAAGAQARATAEAENAKAEMGEGLLPITAKLTDWVGKVGQAFGNLSNTWQNAILIAAGLLAAIGPLTTIIAGITAAVGLLSGAMAFLAANPVVLVIAAVAALAAGLVIAYQKSETFRSIVQAAFGAVGAAASFLSNVFSTAFGWIKDHLNFVLVAIGPIGVAILLLKENWSTAWNAIKTALQTVWGIVKPILDAMSSGLDKIADAAGKVTGAVGKVKDAAGGVVGGVGGAIGGALGKIPFFDDGGVVPGPIGAPRLAMVHGGETVLPTHKDPMAGGPGGPTFNFYGLTVPEVVEAIAREQRFVQSVSGVR